MNETHKSSQMKTFFHILSVILLSAVVIVLGNRCYHAMSKSETNFETEDHTIEIRMMCEQDLWLDTEGIDTKDSLLHDLVDMGNATAAIRSIFSDFDLYMRMVDYESETRDAIRSFDLSVIKNSEIRTHIEAFRQKMIELYDVRPDEVDQDVVNPYLYLYDEEEYIADRYALTHYYYGDIDALAEKLQLDYWTCASIPDWDTLQAKRGDLSIDQELHDRYLNSQSFDERCIYVIELAYANEAGHYNDDPYLKYMYELLTCGEYSKYLPSIWYHWRCICQRKHGSSKDSYIPNWIYNQVRNRCLCTILKHIAQHSDDLMALNQFMRLTSYDNIYRLGTFEFGNQNVPEYYELFLEKHNAEDEKE